MDKLAEPRSTARARRSAFLLTSALALAATAFAQTTPTYTISTLAGSGKAGSTGDGGQASAATVNYPLGMTVDSSGNLYYAESAGSCIRKITSGGVISTVAGQCTVYTTTTTTATDGTTSTTTTTTSYAGYEGDGSAATSAKINFPSNVIVDSSGNLFIADTANHLIRKVGTDGKISTYAFQNTAGNSGDHTASYPSDTSLATTAKIGAPTGMAFDADGNLYVADSTYSRIRKITLKENYVFGFAGTGADNFGGGDGAPAPWATFDHPVGIAFDTAGNMYVADQLDHKVRKIAAKTFVTTTFAGTGIAGSEDTGYAVTSQLADPSWVAVDANNNVFIVDQVNCRIRMVRPDGSIVTIAGNGSAASYGDGGMALDAALFYPTAIAIGKKGEIYVAESQDANGNLSGGKIRVLTPVQTNGGKDVQPVHGKRPPVAAQ